MSLPVLFILGDSISVHYGEYLEPLLKGVFEVRRKLGDEEALKDLDVPRGANGGDSSMMLEFLKPTVEKGVFCPEMFLINCGLHDIKTHPVTGEKQVPLAQYRENLEAIVELIKPLPCQMAWMRTTPCDEKIHNNSESTSYRYSADVIAYNEAADEIMKRNGVPIIDLYTFTLNLGKSEEIYCDHVHFHQDVRKKQAEYLADIVMGKGDVKIS